MIACRMHRASVLLVALLGGLVLSACQGSSSDCLETGCEVGACEFSSVPDGSATCVTECVSSWDFVDRSLVCHDGVPTQCGEVPAGVHCVRCHNCDAGEYCFVSIDDPEGADRCLPAGPVGGPCQHNDECQSYNCTLRSGFGTTFGECLVAAGEPCTDENCERCLTTPGGTTLCRQRCSQVSQCDHLDGHQCAREGGDEFYFCQPICDPDGTCPPGQVCREVRLMDPPEGTDPTSDHCFP